MRLSLPSGARRSFPTLLVPALILAAPAWADGQVEATKAIARQGCAFLSARHFDAAGFRALHTGDFVKHYNSRPETENLDQEMRDYEGMFKGSSDLDISVDWMVAEGDRVAVCGTAQGTNDGPVHGLPPTGRKFRVSAMHVWRMAGGKIAEEWVFFDDQQLYQQLGFGGKP